MKVLEYNNDEVECQKITEYMPNNDERDLSILHILVVVFIVPTLHYA